MARWLQDAADLSPGGAGKQARETEKGRERRRRHLAPGRAVAGGTGSAGLLIPSPPPSSPSPPRPLRPEAASSQAPAVSALWGKGTAGRGEERGTREGVRPAEGRRGGGSECARPWATEAGVAACWGQAWTLGCRREFLPSSGHLPRGLALTLVQRQPLAPRGQPCPGVPPALPQNGQPRPCSSDV